MDPVTLAAGAVAVTAVALTRKSKQPVVPPRPDCGAQAAMGAVTGVAAGAAAGAPAGGVGAGVGAGIGIIGALSGPCGDYGLGKKIGKAVSDASKSACQKADDLYRQIKNAGGDVPGYSHMSCDQKLAACIAAASPLGIAVVAVDVVAGSLASGAKGVVKGVGSGLAGLKKTASAGASVGNSNTGASVSTSGGSASVGGVTVASW
jgi:hypothetical protein